MPALMRLTNPIRPYDWGSVTALPELLGVEPTGRPQAELWLGAHPAAPSTVDGVPLTELIRQDPVDLLGAQVVSRFGPRLPYLLKILAIERPLSLQVHPTTAQAEAGFADEEARKIPLDGFARSYKDRFHKPELVCAITEFHGLCGFREPTATAALLEHLGLPVLRPWIDLLRTSPPAQALRSVFTQMLAEEAKPIVALAEQALADAVRSGQYGDDLAAYAGIAHAYPGDRGTLAALLLNHVRLQPGQALFLGAGVPHAYLGGLAVEIMAGSDNVLRCGLTTKHIDVPELLHVVDFVPSSPFLVRPDLVPDGHDAFRYLPPTAEFSLIRHDLTEGTPHDLSGGLPQIVLCLDGTAQLSADTTLTLHRGESAFIPAGIGSTRLSGAAVIYRACPPA